MQTILYVYVDESGQDTEGQLFIVSVVIALSDPDALGASLERIEKATGKQRKWHKTPERIGINYLQQAKQLKAQAVVYVETHRTVRDYFVNTASTIASALRMHGVSGKRAYIKFDALPRTKEYVLLSLLRKQGAPAWKASGVNDEKEPLIRLADAVCGLVRGATLGRAGMQAALSECVKSGFVIEMGQ